MRIKIRIDLILILYMLFLAWNAFWVGESFFRRDWVGFSFMTVLTVLMASAIVKQWPKPKPPPEDDTSSGDRTSDVRDIWKNKF